MERVLLQVKQKKDRRRLEDWLSKSYHIVLPNKEHPLEEEVDLVIIDGPSLKQLRSRVKARRRAERSTFLPFLLLTVRRRSSMPGRHLGRVVDDLLIRPLNEKELQDIANKTGGTYRNLTNAETAASATLAPMKTAHGFFD